MRRAPDQILAGEKIVPVEPLSETIHGQVFAVNEFRRADSQPRNDHPAYNTGHRRTDPSFAVKNGL